MFGSIGGPELLVIFVVALLIFGPRRLSEIGRTLGRAMGEFRRAAFDLRSTLDAEVARVEAAERRDRSPAPTGVASEALPEPNERAITATAGLGPMDQAAPAGTEPVRPDPGSQEAKGAGPGGPATGDAQEQRKNV